MNKGLKERWHEEERRIWKNFWPCHSVAHQFSIAPSSLMGWRLLGLAAMDCRSGRGNWNLDSTKIKYVFPKETFPCSNSVTWAWVYLIVQDKKLTNRLSDLPLVIPLACDSVAIWIWCPNSKGFFSFMITELYCGSDELLCSCWGIAESWR